MCSIIHIDAWDAPKTNGRQYAALLCGMWLVLLCSRLLDCTATCVFLPGGRAVGTTTATVRPCIVVLAIRQV